MSTARSSIGVLRDCGRGVRRSILRDAREWRADDHTSGCERPRRAVSPSRTRATAEGWGARARTTGAALRSECWVAHESLRRCVAITSATVRLRALGPTRWSLLSGRIHRHPTVSFGALCGMRPRRFLREVPEPPRPSAVLPSGKAAPSVARSQTRPKHLAFPRRSGRGRRSGWPARRNVQHVWAARNARQHRNESIQSPREHRAGAQRKRRALATDSSTEESPEVGEQSSAAWRHGSEHGSKRREGTPAGVRGRVRKDETR